MEILPRAFHAQSQNKQFKSQYLDNQTSFKEPTITGNTAQHA
jgi:hypothetical protein